MTESGTGESATGRQDEFYLGTTTGRGKNDQTYKSNRSIKAVWGYPLAKYFRHMLPSLTDNQIAEKLNKDGLVSATGRPFTKPIVSWIRHKYSIPSAELKRPEELTVKQFSEKFEISHYDTEGFMAGNKILRVDNFLVKIN